MKHRAKKHPETSGISAELYKALLNQSADGIVISDAQERFIEVNARACAMLAYTREEMLERTWQDVVLAEDWATQPLGSLDQPPNTSALPTYRLHGKDGRVVPVEINLVLLPGALRLAMVRDIAEHKRLETQLLQAQKMDTIGQLAGGIAHDFNNMLTAIVGCIGSAQEQLAQEHPVQSDLQIAESSAWRAAGLTRQLLAFARKQIFEPRVLNLNEVIVDMDRLVRRLIGKDIELITLPAAGLGQIKADPGQIEQVLANLVVNARDAMPAGGRLTIETANALLDASYARQRAGVIPGEYVMLAVSDTGIGMAGEIQQHIFEPFFTTKEVGKGTGLGLATCYGIVKQHGGNIWVYSEIGQGTTFKIYLPRVDEAADNRPRDVDDSPVPSGTEIVFLVDDEPLVREVTAHILRKQGYTVLEAGSGDEALRIARGYTGAAIALLITDVVMPQMSGKVLAGQMTRLYPTINVLFISGYATNAIAHQGRLEQGINFLSKPFTPAALLRKVRKILDTAEGAAP